MKFNKTKLITMLLLVSVFILSISTMINAKGEWKDLTKEEWEKEDQIPAASIIELNEFKQAPDLEEKVKEGEIPSVEERLPSDPVVVNPVESIGQYGGTWNRVYGGGMTGMIMTNNGGRGLYKWDRESLSYLTPNVAKDWTWNSDKTKLTFEFVEGIRWSDGTLLTVDDFIFWWEDIILDDSLPYAPPEGAHIDGEPMEVNKINDFKVELKFTEPNPMFFTHFAFPSNFQCIVPSHYFKELHPKYNDELEEEDTEELMSQLDSFWWALDLPDIPTYRPWQLVEYKEGERKVWERNPYYFKVDPEGNQLPYIDRVISRNVEEREMAVLQAINGNIDFQARTFSFENFPLLIEKQEEGDYTVLKWKQGDLSTPTLNPGYDYPEEKVRDIIFNKNFRRALSHLIDREKINQMIFNGLGTPFVGLLREGFSDVLETEEGRNLFEKWENSWTYNPEEANKLLDEMGMVDVNEDGWRERPDGEPFEFIVDLNSEWDLSLTSDIMEIIKQEWEEAGIKTNLNPTPGTALSNKLDEGDYMMYARPYDSKCKISYDGFHFMPIVHVQQSIHPQAALYYQTGGEQGNPPRTDYFEKMQELYTEASQTPDIEERLKLYNEIYKIHYEEGPLKISVVGDITVPVVKKNNFHNVVEVSELAAWRWGTPGLANPEQFYMTE